MLRPNGHWKSPSICIYARDPKRLKSSLVLFDQWQSMVLKDEEYFKLIFKTLVTSSLQDYGYKCFFVAWDRYGVLKHPINMTPEKRPKEFSIEKEAISTR